MTDCSLPLFHTTRTDESDMAAAAVNGLSGPGAASGIAALSYPSAQDTLPVMVDSPVTGLPA